MNRRAGGGVDSTASSASRAGGNSVTPVPMSMERTGGTIEEKWVCGVCLESLDTEPTSIGCDGPCQCWYHVSCVSAGKTELSASSWYCTYCRNYGGYCDAVEKEIRHLRNQISLSVELQQQCVWGSMKTLEEVNSKLQHCYDQIITWRKNFFLVPRGNAGKDLISELTRLVNLFNDDTIWKPIALKALMVFLPMMLQKPSKKSKAKDHCRYLANRLKLWANGDLDSILKENKEIQRRIESAKKSEDDTISRRFARLMMAGKLGQASKLINRTDGGLLKCDAATVKLLKEKHPEEMVAEDLSKLKGPLPKVENVIFESIDAEMVSRAAARTMGSGGPTLIDADCWKHILCAKSFKTQQVNLCESLAKFTKIMCCQSVNPHHITELTAGRLIPLAKQPSGVRPIGVGEVIRRIIGKCVMIALKSDIEDSVGCLQTCAGQEAGIEAAIHAMHDIYESDDSEGMLLVDASNAFNAMNRNAGLRNVQLVCPEIATYLRNTYQKPSKLYINGGKGEFILSTEGTTQGDNAAMAFYAISTHPLINSLGREDLYSKESEKKATQAWFADDSSASGTLGSILIWWKELLEIGPMYGYFPNESKCVLIVKNEDLRVKAEQLFSGYNLEITTQGKRHLGATIGSAEYKAEYVVEKVNEWVDDVKQLASIAKTEPQSAYAAMIFSIQHRWKFIQRTVPGISELFKPLEQEIFLNLIPAIVGRQISDTERDIFALPVRFGGMGIPKPDQTSDFEYAASRKVTKYLQQSIINQAHEKDFSSDVVDNLKKLIKVEKEIRFKRDYHYIFSHADIEMKRSLEAASETGASSWLTVLPLNFMGYSLNKVEFRDSVALRYNWTIKDIPNFCACGEKNDVNHSLICKMGGYIIFRHNRLRDDVAKFMKEVCIDVQTEPSLSAVEEYITHARGNTNTATQARLDIAGRGVWSPSDRAFFDIRVTHPNSRSNQSLTLKQIYDRNEREKMTAYNDRVLNVERGSFTPLVFLTTGGMSKQCCKFTKRLAEKIADKKGERYADVINHIRTKLRFSLLKSTLIGLRGYRGAKKSTEKSIDEISFNLIPVASILE